MTTLIDGLPLLKDIVVNDLAHQDYDRVNELAERYHKIVTGDGIESLLTQFVQRESDAQFDQRKRITQQITPSVASSISTPFYKVGRVNSVDKKIALSETEETDKKLKDISSAIESFYGDKGVDKYLETRLVELNFTDPNSFIVVEFGPFDPAQEKPKPYPFEVSSKEAFNFFYDNNILQWLVVKLPVNITVEGKATKAHSYTMYLANESAKFTPVDPAEFSLSDGEEKEFLFEDGIKTVYKIDKNRCYIIETFEHKSGRVPAIRVGYKRDLSTKGRTMVGPIEPAMPHFMKSIKTVSEFDLTMALHAFPQKLQNASRCMANECSGGMTPEGGICGSCKGTGVQAHTSAQDILLYPMPKKAEDMVDLTKVVHYVYPPTELLRFQDEQVEKLEAKAHRAIFNSMMFAQNTMVKTATEVDVNLDSVYDTLYAFAERYSDIYVYICKVIAALRGAAPEKTVITYRFPKDFKFKGVDELLLEFKTANESGAPGYIKQEISNDIAERQFQDKPEELSRIKIKQRFFPFSDKTSTEILYIVSNGLTTEYNKVLWSNFESIFRELELDNEDFYLMAYEKQKALVDEKVNVIVGSLEQKTPALFNSSFGSEE
jgi:hypothetical protein